MSEDKEGYYIGTAKVIGGCATRRVTNVESTIGNALHEKNESPSFNLPVSITVISYRQRLCDPDGISFKAALDGLVNCGILRDDSTEEIEEIRYRQIKVKSKEEEQTQIIIEEIAND